MLRRFPYRTMFCVGLMILVGWCAAASDATMYFSSDKNGQHRVTNVQEGDEIWIVVIDSDENTDCDVRDKFWTDVKLMDPKTGAYIVWKSYESEDGSPHGEPNNDYDEAGYIPYKGHSPGPTAGWLGGDYLEETGPDTSVFVSKRSFQIGTRESFSASEPWEQTHVVDQVADGQTDDFRWGHYLYADFDGDGHADNRGWFGAGGIWGPPQFNLQMMLDALSPSAPSQYQSLVQYLLGRFENMDTLIGMVQDPNDAGDVAIAMMKIIDTEAAIRWDRDVYADGNETATVTVVDADENLNCNEVEAVPVFILVNPGSWNPVDDDARVSPTNFCTLKRTGGVNPAKTIAAAAVYDIPIRWYNIYNNLSTGDHRYHIQYPTKLVDPDNVVLFDTARPDGIAAVLFYAWETGTDTGVFQLNLNSLLLDLGFNSLNIRDVLVAYYLDPNDFDDFKLATAYIEEHQHSATSFTDAGRTDKDLYWIGRDSVYVQVIDANANVDPCCPEKVAVHVCDPHGEDDAEWLLLDETSSNSAIFLTNAGAQLQPVWDALGVGLSDSIGGFALQLDNWIIEAFNEDDLYVRYNDVIYGDGPPLLPDPDPNGGKPFIIIDISRIVKPERALSPAGINLVTSGLTGLGDLDPQTSFPPWIARTRVANDVSFDLLSVADTQVYDGSTTQMGFLDRQGNPVSGYVNSDCVFIEIYDPDQDEDQYRRERIDGFWDGGQHIPFGPKPLNVFDCSWTRDKTHPVNALLGDTNIFNNSPDPNALIVPCDGEPKIYVLNPRSGRWAAVDLLETGAATGHFVSVTCIDLADVHTCVPTLDVLPGDTIVAFYQDPSNHSDAAMISIKVGIGGGGTPPGQQSTTTFVDADGNEVASYADADLVYVKVVDPSHAGAALLADAVEIAGVTYDLELWYDVQTFAPGDTFRTEGLDLGLSAGDSVTATYTDTNDPADTSSDTVAIVSSALSVDRFYAGPSPFAFECTFGYVGQGTASVLTVEVRDLCGSLLWSSQKTDAREIVWDGAAGAPCRPVANGAYLYTITTTDGTNTFAGRGLIFVNR